MNLEFNWTDVDKCFPGLREVWKRLRKAQGIRTRSPKRVVVTDQPMISTPWHDAYMGRLYRLDLETMALSGESMVTDYDVALYSTNGMVGKTGAVHGNVAVLKISWSDFYRHVTMEIQVGEGGMPAQLGG